MRVARVSLVMLLVAGVGLGVGLSACGKKKKKKAVAGGMSGGDEGGEEGGGGGGELPDEPPPPVEKKVAEGVLTKVEGGVFVRRASETKFAPAAKDTQLFHGDAVRAAGDGAATITLYDGSSVELPPASAVQLNESGSVSGASPSVTVLSGAANFEVEPRAEGQVPLTVMTPTAAVHVQGTSLTVGVGLTGSSRVDVETGQAEVVPAEQADAAPTPVPAGKAVVVNEGKAPKDAPAKDLDKWLAKQEDKAAADAAATAKAHADDMAKADAEAKKVASAEKHLEKWSDEVDEKVTKAQAEGNEEEYAKHQPMAAAAVEDGEAIAGHARLANARLASRAYLLAVMRARAKAKTNMKLAKALAKIEKHAARGRLIAAKAAARLANRWRRRYLRLGLRRRLYYRHHMQGRKLAKRRGIAIPAWFAARKARQRFKKPLVSFKGLYRPRRYRGKVRAAKFQRWRRQGWWKRPAFVTWRQALRAKRAKRRKAWRARFLAPRRKRWKRRPRYAVLSIRPSITFSIPVRAATWRRPWRIRWKARWRARRGMGWRRGMRRLGIRFGMRRGMRFGMRRFGMRYGMRRVMRYGMRRAPIRGVMIRRVMRRRGMKR